VEAGPVISNLEKLVDDIISESKAKAEGIRKAAVGQIEESIARARAEAVREADQIIRDGVTKSDAARNRRVSQEKQKARLAYLDEKNRVLSEIMEEVQKRLVEFCRDESSYRPFLLKAVARGIEAVPSETLRVALSERDLRRFKRTKVLEDALVTTQTSKKVTFSDEPIETVGGAVVMSQDGNMRVDCTLEARLGLMKPQLLPEISKILFAP
jgi:vacuolar-type H+-ATPase subunit E/Vma4